MEQLDPKNKFEFDIPYKDLMFPGVPNKSAVNVLPTVHGLVALDDNPPFVLSLDEVEIAYFERVQFSLKNFDLVFVFRDFDRPIVKIRSIPSEHRDAIQQFLTFVHIFTHLKLFVFCCQSPFINRCACLFLNYRDSDIVYYVGTMSLQWPAILKTIKADEAFFFTEQGGWESMFGEDENGDAEGMLCVSGCNKFVLE